MKIAHLLRCLQEQKSPPPPFIRTNPIWPTGNGRMTRCIRMTGDTKCLGN